MYIVKTASNLNSIITPKRLIEESINNNISTIIVCNNDSSDWLELEEERKKQKSETKFIFSLDKEYGGQRVLFLIKGDVLKNSSLVEKSLESGDLSILTIGETLPVVMYGNNTKVDELKETYTKLFKKLGDAYIGIDSEVTKEISELKLKNDDKVLYFQKVNYIDPTDKELYDIKKRDSGEYDISNRYDLFLKPQNFLSEGIKETEKKLTYFNSKFKVNNEFSSSFWNKDLIKSQPTNVEWERFFTEGYKIPKDELEKKKVYLLCRLAGLGFNKRFKNYPEQKKEKYLKRLKYELTIIVNGGFYEYFLIIQDIVSYGRKNGIRIGHRGSVVGSLVAYTLGITNVDPFKYNLIFERFLNPHRSSRPDIDLEVPASKMDVVFEYIQKKYGEENICKIMSSNRYGFRNAIGIVRKNLGIEDKLEKEFTGMDIPFSQFKETKKGKNILKGIHYKGYDEVIEMAEKYQDLPQSKSIQQGSIVIDDKVKNLPTIKMDNYNVLPLTNSNDDLFKLGLDKIDLLSSRNLDVIEKTWSYLTEEDRRKFDLNDEKTFDLLSNGNKDFVFQLKSKGIQEAFDKMKPQNITDIMAGISLYRPGPMKEIDNYVRNKQTKNFAISTLSGGSYRDFDVLKPILEETNGIIIYQEQIMKIVSVWSGYSDSEADMFRSIVSDKKVHLMKKEKEKFIARSITKGRNEKITEELFALIERFSSYGFPKSHAASYSLLTYETAYLKANYPIHYFLAMLNSNMSVEKVYFKENDSIIKYLEKNGFEILKPNYKVSNGYYKFNNGKIVPGIMSIKGIARKDVGYVLNAQQDMIENKKNKQSILKKLEKKVRKITFETLSKIGYFEN